MKRSGFAPSKKFSSFCRKAPTVLSEKPQKKSKPIAGLLRRSPFKSASLKQKPVRPLSRITSGLKTKRRPLSAAEDRYFRAVAALPCACCGIWGYSQVAHSNQAKYGKGMGLKADNQYVFPLCCDRPGAVGCHTLHDQCIGMTRAEANQREEIYLLDTQTKLGVGK